MEVEYKSLAARKLNTHTGNLVGYVDQRRNEGYSYEEIAADLSLLLANVRVSSRTLANWREDWKRQAEQAKETTVNG